MKENIEHINNDSLREFARNGVANEQDTSILEHISTCDFCLMRYTTIVEEDLLSLPVEFKESVIEKAKELKKPLLKEKQYFYRYCFRVGFACACSILLLFSIDTNKIMDISDKMSHMSSVTSVFDGKFQSVKDYINNLEVNFNEVEEK